jgi:oligopeptide transport system ATP-binding protein
MDDNREVVLSVKNLDVHFKVGRRIVKAVNNVSFDVYKGETFGLVGESGSGKTTVIRTIIGINQATNGDIIYKDELISRDMTRHDQRELKKKIQMIFQDPAASLNERANVDYIVSEGLYNFKLFKTDEERRNKVKKALQDVGLLEEHITRFPHEFSGGQRQRIGIARALVIEPELILADEPISALDVSIRAQVLNLLNKMKKDRDLTYLFIAHDLSIIHYISDRVGVMHQGYLVELADANEIYDNPLHPYTQSLLTAIPQPDPKSERFRKRELYDQTGINYAEGEFVEVSPGHYLLGTPDQIKEWTKK